MKKIVIIIFFVFVISSSMSYQDMSAYQSDTKLVEIKGEVQHPGSYEVALHATIKEVIEKAGGISQDAELSAVNVNLDIEHQGVIVIPKHQEKALISINSASLEELDSLPGVGPAIAQRIIEYRSTSLFRTLDELKEVKGIGDAMYEKLKDMICL